MGQQNQNRGQQPYLRNQPLTFDQFAEMVKKDCFSTNYSELLKMSSTEKLDAVLGSIEDFVQKFGVKVSTSQLRNIYDKAKKEQEVSGLKLIRPQLAYIAGRATSEKDNVKKFLSFIDSLIKLVDSKEKLKEFMTFFEAVVAYHKFYSTTN